MAALVKTGAYPSLSVDRVPSFLNQYLCICSFPKKKFIGPTKYK